MEGDSWILYVLLLALILGGCYFSGTEIAYASSNRIRLKTQAENGSKKAKNAIYILDHFDKALTTLLIGDNIMHIGTSALATMLATHLWGEKSVFATTIVVTVVVFFFSEMLPKSFARSHADQASLSLSGSLRFFMRILTPIAWVFTQISTACAKLFGTSSAPSLTEAELEYMLESAESSPEIQGENEGKLISAAVAFDHVHARQIMQPVDQMEALELHTPVAEIAAFIQSHHHSRIPFFKEDLDHIVGVLHIRDFLRSYLRLGKQTRVRPLLHPVLFVSPEAPIDEVLRQMNGKKIQLAIVSENGSSLGMLTVEDILEELVGDIQDEEDEGTVSVHD